MTSVKDLVDALEKSRAAPSTAYDRDQQALRDAVVAVRDRMLELEGSLLDAVRRIEQLEREVAKLKGPRSILEVIAERLPCGCKPPHCCGHQFSASPVTAYPPLPDEGT